VQRRAVCSGDDDADQRIEIEEGATAHHEQDRSSVELVAEQGDTEQPRERDVDDGRWHIPATRTAGGLTVGALESRYRRRPIADLARRSS